MSAAEVFGWFAAAIVIARMVPQTVRVWRGGTNAGLSPLGLLCWLANDLGWLIYGLRAEMPALWGASVVLLVCDLALVAMAAPQLRGPVGHAGAAWLAVVVACAAAGQAPLGAALVLGSATGTVPHAAHALRQDDLRAVSRASWLVALLDAAAWGVYGAAHGDLPSVSYAALTALSASVILARLHHTARRPAPQTTITSTDHVPVPVPAAVSGSTRLHLV